MREREIDEDSCVSLRTPDLVSLFYVRRSVLPLSLPLTPYLSFTHTHTLTRTRTHFLSLSRAAHASQKPFIARTPYGIYPNKNTSERGKKER